MSVDGDLVRPCPQQGGTVGRAAHAASDRERNREPLGHARNELEQGRASVKGRLDVEEDQFVGTGVGIGRPELDRVPSVPEVLEAHAFDHAPRGDVQTGDQTGERHRFRNRAPAAPLFSGWNWTPTKLPNRASATIPSDVADAVGVSAA